ncbi:DNA polymerase III subunit beta [Arthrobacter sp. PsM3]|uniref:DNA polymerase III subunit beta n=1 Tax=Arthrobacter sp. PsM3 TaxID=3030531 RepID=UPI00263B56CC|nr:DNA polymerase III subunit beta [Arthrobacter sp. PsM3]MDN4644953.1 DNA polymerase III subunit beta [Arthrobacter sp. PsM3]
MKFTLTADALADAAAFASKGISPRPPVPVLSGLLIEAQEGGLRISGFDYEKSARTQVAADVAEAGTVLLQGKMFTDIIRKFGRKTVTVAVDGNKATLTAGSAVFTMHAMPVSEFPPMPPLPAAVGAIDGDVFAAAVGQVIGATSNDDTIKVLTGVHIVSEGDELTLRTTDRYRLAEAVIPWRPTGDDIDVLVPGKWLGDLVKTLAGEATIVSDGNLIGIRTGNRATTSIKMDGDFPKIKALFPDTSHTEVKVNRAEFAEILARVSLVAERNTPVRLTACDGELIVEAGTGEDAQGRETLPCEIDGTNIVVAVNPMYLAWSLSVSPAADVVLEFQENLGKPVLLSGHDGMRHLIMPVKL